MIRPMATEGIGTRIAKRRQVLGLTQVQLADRIGVTESSVVNWETGKHYPRRYLGKLEAILGVSLTEEDGQPAIPTDPEERALWDVLGDMNMDPADRWRVIGAAREARRQRATG